MVNSDIILKLKEIGAVQESENSFYKEAETPISFNYAYFHFFGGNFLSIRVGKKDHDYERMLLKGFYIENGQALLNVLSKLVYLSNIFPEIVSVPQLNVVIENTNEI